jgi:hypothetical protein
MFIREKIKTVKGKKYIQHQLIESIRTPAGPRQRLILNLGFLDLQQDKWKELTNSTVAYFMIHKNRSKEAFMELIKDWRGILVSADTWKNTKPTAATAVRIARHPPA